MTTSLQILRGPSLTSATDEQLGGALTALYHDAQAAEMAFLKFGAAFHAVEQLVSGTRAGNSPERGPGSYGFESWLRDHAPDVSPRTARRYRDIARATAEKFRIENPMDVFSLPVEDLSEADRAKRAKALEFVSDKSMRGIQLELGLVHRPKGGNLGGVRGKAPVLTPEEQLAARVAYARDWYQRELPGWRQHFLELCDFEHLPEEATFDGELTLSQFIQLLDTVKASAQEVLKTRRGRAVA
jgi:hypothetical protein